MPFCGKCGKQLKETEAFCTACGTKVPSEAPENAEFPDSFTNKANYTETPHYQTSPKTNTFNTGTSSNADKVAQLALFQVFSIAAAALLQLLDGIPAGILINGAMAALIFLFVFKKLKTTGVIGYSYMISLACGALSGIVGILGLLKGQIHYTLVYGATAILAYMIYKEAQKK